MLQMVIHYKRQQRYINAIEHFTDNLAKISMNPTQIANHTLSAIIKFYIDNRSNYSILFDCVFCV